MRTRLLFACLLSTHLALAAEPELEPKPADPALAPFAPVKAPAPAGPLLRKGDRLAICGDSITQQQRYSRVIETYLAACTPELEIQARQYGWSGEKASGFLNRMKNDCLRFAPTVATTCYGMNDHRYQPYREEIGAEYREKMTAVVKEFEAAGVRVVIGSPGTVGKMPSWVKTASGTVEDLNLSLCQLRNIGLEIAGQEHQGFADIFWPMLTRGLAARERFGADYAISGRDGVHPGWAGHLVMAFEFLKAFGLDGEIGTLTMDLDSGKATATAGHEIAQAKPGELSLVSRRYPFCATGAVDRDDSLRSGMELVPFNQELNRLTLRAVGGKAELYTVSWGAAKRQYTAKELAAGVNLAADFPENPFSAAFKKVDDAVAAKEGFEHDEIQNDFRSPEAKKDMEAVVTRDEVLHERLAAAITAAVVPVTHDITVTPVVLP